MRVFVTGASGYIGNAVAKAFRNKGHHVFGMVRSEKDAHLLSLDEIWPVIGDLDKLESYQKALEECEVAVHCAFDWEEKGVERDAKLIDNVLATFSKSSLPHAFLYTSGIWIYGSRGNQVVDESTPVNPIEIAKWRPIHEEKVLKAAAANFKTVILRPGCVYGNVGGLTNLIFTSTQNGMIKMIGEGRNRWPMVHVQDLALAYVAAAEKEANGLILNVANDTSVTVKELAEAVARSAGIEGKIKSLTPEEAHQQFGDMVQGLSIDLQVSNSRVKRLLGWQVHHPSFINDVDIYYNAWKTTQVADEF
ncbi:NAD-dependent epimerase/dehydratase family protein [Candidatus Protochlamydia phocaeensis]|uniref:NAD-dependent epimerase/dehydratase family protein n=1 Tax=Candidatus Protochlamydia phocaeensis TaxID=1414722 RepID=UPI0008390607|nr:NAD-dependent epimerase/dehydratase family protein [Candidatus Protochlamydia phocaeensis]